MPFVAGARWTFRGKDAGCVDSFVYRHTRGRSIGVQRVPGAQSVFRRTLLAAVHVVFFLEVEKVEQVAQPLQAVARRCGRTTGLEVATGRCRLVERVVAGREGRQAPVALDELQRRDVVGRPP
jgi:hypothetical protein